MEFKVGDWVRFRKDKIGKIRSVYQDKEYTLHNVISPAGNGRYCAYHTEFSKHELTLWQPKEGEWVCVDRYDDNLFTVCKFNSHFLDYKDCEPFNGELPSFLKDS